MYMQARTQLADSLASLHPISLPLIRRFKLIEKLDYTQELYFDCSGERHGSYDRHRSPDRTASISSSGELEAGCLLTDRICEERSLFLPPKCAFKYSTWSGIMKVRRGKAGALLTGCFLTLLLCLGFPAFPLSAVQLSNPEPKMSHHSSNHHTLLKWGCHLFIFRRKQYL